MSAASGSSLQAELEHALARQVDGQVRFDTVARVLYSTDASNHQVEPLGVVLPRHDEALQAVIEIAAEFRVPLIARGAGTGLAGQAIGSGLIVGTSRYLDRLVGFDLEARTVSVEPGAVLGIHAEAACGRQDRLLQLRQVTLIDWLPTTVAVHRDSAAMDVTSP